MFNLPTLGLVIGSATISAINPITIAIFVLILSSILGSGKSRKRLVVLGSAFIVSIYLTNLLVGIGVLYALGSIPVIASYYLSIIIGITLVTVGLIEIKDYFWYGKGVSMQIPSRFTNKIHEHSARKSTVPGIMLLGGFVALVQLPFTGAAYLAITTILRTNIDMGTIILMKLFCAVFVLPLAMILIMVIRGSKISTITKWKEESKGVMRLFIGLLLISLGWILLLIANGTINLG
jgi:cytochrome c biogenesis protein CcdA